MIGAACFAKVRLNALEQTLAFCGLQNIAPDVEYMFYPLIAPPSNRHYLYVGGAWTATGSTIDGTMLATGAISGGAGTHVITLPATTVSRVQVIWYSAATVQVVAFEMGFNRVLTTAEQSALSTTSFLTALLAGTGLTISACYAVYAGDGYYVDSVNGDDGDSGSITEPFETIAAAVTADTAANKSALYLAAGSTGVTQFSVPRASFVVSGYGRGAQAIINIEGTAAEDCLYLNNTSDVLVQHLSMIGSGIGACVRVIGTSGAGGYSVRGLRLNVLRNYASVNGDGYSLAGTAEMTLTDCNATKCREEGAGAGSHQCVTTHDDSKVSVVRGLFTDSNNAFVGVGNSLAAFTGSTASACRLAAFGVNGENAICAVADSEITVSDATGTIASLGTVGYDDQRLTFTDCSIIATNGAAAYIRKGLCTFSNCTFAISSTTFSLQPLTGTMSLMLEDCTFAFTGTGYSYPIYCSAAGMVARRCDFGGLSDGRYITIANSAVEQSQIYDNIFTASGTAVGVLVRTGTRYGPTVFNNLFVGAAKAIYNQGTNDLAGAEVKNNIFEACTDAVDGTTGLTLLNNCYHDTTSEGETGAVVADPLFIAAPTNYRLQAGSPCINTGVDVGLTTDKDKHAIPVGAGFDIGPYEYGSE